MEQIKNTDTDISTMWRVSHGPKPRMTVLAKASSKLPNQTRTASHQSYDSQQMEISSQLAVSYEPFSMEAE
jgi:hypothetical protein